MNLTKLFEMQKELDAKIVREKGLEGQDLLPQKILALQVELGECANEWRGFKFWSKNQNANRTAQRQHFDFDKLVKIKETYDPLLEEYVDCLHFILSIGLDLKANEWHDDVIPAHKDDLIQQFVRLFDKVGDFSAWETRGNYEMIIDLFVGLGEMLGFTWEEIVQAYCSKNEVNHQRQATGY